ncbi:hypothetical protein AAVH_36418, partial [Aphelenchoides avenae]
MIPELRYELLFYYTRDDLERLQPLSQTLLDMIVAGSNVLPLRPIYCVHMGSYGSEDKIQIFVKMSTIANESEPDYEASVHDGDFEETVRRLQNVRIKYFHFGVRDNAFLRYWVVQETAAFTVVSIDFFDRPEAKDYGLLDAIVNHLRPRTAQFNDYESSWHELLKFLYRDSFLRNLQTCRLNVGSGNAFPPSSLILKEPGYRNYVLRFSDSNIAVGIDGLIE